MADCLAANDTVQSIAVYQVDKQGLRPSGKRDDAIRVGCV